jgi:hypothetical protein
MQQKASGSTIKGISHRRLPPFPQRLSFAKQTEKWNKGRSSRRW